VRLLSGSLGSFNNSLCACQLDTRFVLAETSTAEMIAATIVHEATHARLRHRGIGYEEDQRARVEAVCFRRERAFAAKLPNGDAVREQAERSLEWYASPDHWTDAAFSEFQDKGNIEALRYLGTPDWLIRVVLAMRSLRLGVRRFVRGLTQRHTSSTPRSADPSP